MTRLREFGRVGEDGWVSPGRAQRYCDIDSWVSLRSRCLLKVWAHQSAGLKGANLQGSQGFKGAFDVRKLEA